MAWDMMVFLQKMKRGYWGIGVVKVVWKVCVTVVNCRIKSSVNIHNALHRFRAGRGTGVATLESNLAQQLEGISHELLFQVFLDKRKYYDSLDRGWCMEILWGYGMGKIMARLIAHHWYNLMFVPKVKRFRETPLCTGRGFT